MGRTPLHYAAAKGSRLVADDLLSKGLKVGGGWKMVGRGVLGCRDRGVARQELTGGCWLGLQESAGSGQWLHGLRHSAAAPELLQPALLAATPLARTGCPRSRHVPSLLSRDGTGHHSPRGMLPFRVLKTHPQ